MRRDPAARSFVARTIVLALLVLLATTIAGVATAMREPVRNFPALSGRVVDAAGIVPPDAKAAIAAKLQALEEKSGIQLVVATIKSLGGQDPESYANELFRFWKLGEAKNNNGALLFIALDERKARIEVGYGLEGTLTDAASRLIIANAIAPRFQAKDYGGGIVRAVDDIVATLSTDSGDWTKRPKLRHERELSWVDLLPMLLFFGFVILMLLSLQRRTGAPGGRRSRQSGGPDFFPIPIGTSNWGSDGGSSSGGFSGGDGGDSFSGGGGSSGGGGATGSW